ncbi:MAG: ACP S-malonyltransferase [Methylococcaceae bacterium]|jgi:[acyl-carrier-protein] S-malonyltransferase
MSSTDKGLAFLFPGQGSQAKGMLAELAQHHPEVSLSFAQASDVLGYDLWRLVQEGPEDQLNSTEFTQPAMLAAGVAVWRVWCAGSEVRPALMAGHSLGEYTALVCAGALAFEAGLRLVVERARLMQQAVPARVGAMAAILGLEDGQVVDVCRKASSATEVVTAANFNAPGQVVIAGSSAAVVRATEMAKAAGAKRAVMLPVSVPSHCPLMQPAAETFRSVLENIAFQTPTTAVIHNVDVKVHSDLNEIRYALEQQLYGSVRWAETINYMVGQGVTRFIECGPGRVLAGLNKRIVTGAATETLSDTISLAKAASLVS